MRKSCTQLFLLAGLLLLLQLATVKGAEKLGCESHKIDIRCPPGQVIQISASFYGREDSKVCHTDDAGRMTNTKCSLPRALQVTGDKCDNKTMCIIDVSSATFDDPCPETYKYVKINYKCVTYLFGCPGTLVGLLKAEEVDSSLSGARPASWIKDPLSRTKSIYFHVDQDVTIKAFESEEKFRRASAFDNHDLRVSLSSTAVVVYNSNFYFYQKPNVLTRKGIKFANSINSKLIADSDAAIAHVHIASDEQGLWLTYYHGSQGMIIHRFDPRNLNFVKTYRTGIKEVYKHVVFVCGVMYTFGDGANVGRASRRAIVFNTNLDDAIPYAHLIEDPNNVLGGSNVSALHYNPRDRLIYGWERDHPVYISLLFVPKDPTKENLTPPHTEGEAGLLPHDASPPFPDPTPSSQEKGKCAAQLYKGIEWPQTDGDQVREVQCGDNKTAKWKCDLDPASGEAGWENERPNLDDCFTSLHYMLARTSQGDKDAVARLPSFVERRRAQGVLGPEQMGAVAEATRKFAELMWEGKVEEHVGMVKAVIATVNYLTDRDSVRTIRQLSGTKRNKYIDDLISCVETALLAISSSQPSDQGAFEMRLENVIAVGEKYTNQNLYDYQLGSANNSQRIYPQPASNYARLPAQNGKDDAGDSRVGFALYRNLDECIYNSDKSWRLDSELVSISLRPSRKKQVSLQNAARVTLRHQDVSRRREHKCVYWSFSNSGSSSPWSEEGCWMVLSNESHTTCECRHLTTFALLAQYDDDDDTSGLGEEGADVESDAEWDGTLVITMSVGISVSSLCLFCCFATFIVFTKLKNDLNCIVKHFSAALFVAELSYMVAMHRPSNETVCYVAALLLHLSLLATFVWLAMETFQIYVLLGDYVEPSSRRWKWFYLIGYGGPGVIVMVSAFVNIRGYQGSTWCWLDVQSSSMLAFILPLIVAVITSVTFLIITTIKLHRQSNVLTDSGRLRTVKSGVRSAGSLLFLLGLTWMFGLVWMWERSLIIAYLFLFFNVFQGFFVFFVHCVLQRKVRHEYTSLLNRWRCCSGKSHMGDMTYVSSSMSFSKHYMPPGGATRYNAPVPCSSNINPNQQGQLRRLWSETIVNGGSTPNANQHPSESAAILYNSESVPTREQSISNYGGGSGQICTANNGGYLEPQICTGSQQQAQEPPTGDYCHSSGRSAGLEQPHGENGGCHRENTYKYDRLDRHGNPGDDAAVSQGAEGQAARNGYADIAMECSCVHRHHNTAAHPPHHHQQAPSRQPRSFTMNHQHGAVGSNQPACTSRHHVMAPRASTISKAVQQQQQHWPDEYGPRHRTGQQQQQQDEMMSSASMCVRPYQITPLASISSTSNRRRTSMNSTEESDITNDMSTSSFENRHRQQQQQQHKNKPHNPPHHHQQQRWTPVTSPRSNNGYDENDLEVERCLFSRENGSSGGGGGGGSSNGGGGGSAYAPTERDSAFYQSMPDLNHQATPSSNLCYESSPSSGCSPEMASADDELHHHQRRASAQTALIPPQSVAGAVSSSSASSSARSKPVYEDVSLLGDADHLQPRPAYVLTASRLNRADDFTPAGESPPVRLSGSHLQTCL